jgi:hypothetical protein
MNPQYRVFNALRVSNKQSPYEQSTLTLLLWAFCLWEIKLDKSFAENYTFIRVQSTSRDASVQATNKL